ncbi:hypothetical protein PCL1606_13520 [Pseudomonas chlororaphis]|uniref:Uncharacterized protein n=1 Tax=Pseudomonas chlororaphis TaxID=587753 RepID=A0A0D5XVP4_9PSED|nr:hypothetical protein PCL1606_13520 [Pseudomonas chlororaphis]
MKNIHGKPGIVARPELFSICLQAQPACRATTASHNNKIVGQLRRMSRKKRNL